MELSDIRSTKFFLPPSPHDYVVRPRLESLLDFGSEYAVTLVSAPAGFGKSTLVSSWLTKKSTQYCWVSLAPSENNYISFVMHVVGSVSEIMPEFFRRTQGAIKSSETPSEGSVTTELINELSHLNEDLFIALDDFHLIDQPGILEMIQALIENPIPKLHLILIARGDDNLPIDHWRRKARVVEIQHTDLRFSQTEISQLLELNKLNEDNEIASARLMQFSEGWATGLRLILQDVYTNEDLRLRIEESDGKNTVDIFHYAFKKLEKEYPDRMFLLQIASLFDRFNAEILIYASSGRHDIVETDILGSFLSALAKNHSLVIPLDNQNNWYRFHHLLKDYLRNRLLEEYTPEEIKFMHQNAADWFSMRKLLPEAIEQFIEADSYPDAIHIFDHFRWRLLDSNNWVQMEALLSKFDDHSSIELSLARCWSMIYQARVFDFFSMLPEIEKEVNEIRNEERRARLAAEYNALNPYYLYNANLHNECIASCELAIKTLAPHQTYALGYAYIFLIGSLQATGNYTEAVSMFRSTLQNRKLDKLRPHLWLVLNYIGWIEADIHALLDSSDGLIVEANQTNNQEACSNGFHFKGLAALSSGKFTEAIDCFSDSYKYRYSTIGVIHIMNSIAYVHALLMVDQFSKAREVMIELRKYVQLKANDYFSDILKYVELEFICYQNDFQGIVSMIDRLPLVPLINYSNFFIPRLSLIKSLLRIKEVERASIIVSELKERFESTSNRSGLLRLKPFELEIAKVNGLEWKEAFVQWVLECRSSQLEGFLKYAEDIVVPMSRETGVDLPSFISESNITLRDLSKRELQISQLLFLSNKEISERLYISDKTVKSHVNSIFRKLGVTTREEVLEALNISG